MPENSEKDYGLVFNAAAIKEKGGLTVSRDLPPEVFDGLFTAPDGISKASAGLDFSVGGESLLLEASVRAEVRMGCARCGKTFTTELSDTFDEVYEDTVEFIDVRGPVRESVALMMPLKPLCAPACRGLCSVCGGDLNLKPCGCAADGAPLQNDMKPFGALKGFSVPPPSGKRRSGDPEGKKRRK